ncbi:MAG TPA: M28 family peptidase, partial [Candidatus Krumholzibacteria bacterium]|nr:M28 family peptidase [Candidatus Krumholzibacteria bacterium]
QLLKTMPRGEALLRRARAATLASAAALAAMAAGCGASEPPAGSVDSVMVHVERQLSFGPRVPGTPARDAAARYLARALERYGARVSLQSFEVEDPYELRRLRLINVVGSFAPERTRRIMLCAHYDSRPWADQERDSTLWTEPIPGAVDGATGVAVLLEVARLVGLASPGEIGVDVVLFDGEDYGKRGNIDHYLLGSKHFVMNLNGYRPQGAILLDMVGGKGTRIRREPFSKEHARAFLDHVFARAAALRLDYFEAADGAPMIDDHVPLLQAGIPAIDLFGYDYAAWHTLGDDLSQVDPAKLSQVLVLLRDLLYDRPFPAE